MVSPQATWRRGATKEDQTAASKVGLSGASRMRLLLVALHVASLSSGIITDAPAQPDAVAIIEAASSDAIAAVGEVR